jgi:uncharacterized protein YjbI with pentapeptide repeats
MDRINVTAHTPAECSAAPWRRAGAWWVTVVVKATFRLVPGQLAQPTAPLALVRDDRHRAPTPSSLEAASDTVAPYLPGTGVVLTGHAYSPGGRAGTATTARLAIGRERPLLDKSLHAYGDRLGTVVQPFEKMPLVYERAYGGPGIADNPVGIGAPGTTVSPNLYDARRPEQPAGFGPISRSWPARRRLLGAFDEQALHAPEPEIPEGLDWRYFHAAPPDQQIEHLRGDEWIVLDGMHPTLARVQTRLPSAVGKARWHLLSSSGAGAGTAIDLVADTLIIDADSLICSVLWRGRFALKRPEMAAWVGVSAGVELAGQPIPWPEIRDPSRAELETAKTMAFRLPREAMGPGPPSAMPNPLAGTSALDLRALGVSVLPFSPADPNRSAALGPTSEERWPVVERASEAVSGTASIDFQQIIKAIVPFRPAAPPPLSSDDPAATGVLDARMIRPALPFAPPDPSKIPLEPPAASASRSVVPRGAESLTGTLQGSDFQELRRGVLPFGPDPRFNFGSAPPAELVREPEPPALALRAPVVEAPRVVSTPPALSPPPVVAWPSSEVAAPPPVDVPSPHLVKTVSPQVAVSPSPAAVELPQAPVKIAPFQPARAVETAVKAPSSETALSLRDQVLARLQTGQSLQGLSLVAADLHELDFKATSLSGLDLRRSNLRRANLSDVQAAETQLESADLTEANLEGADLNRANLSRAIVTKASFKGANLTGANLQRLVGDAPNFHAARLQGADLRQAQIPGTMFDEAGLRNASTTKADLTGSRFVRADLAGANLRESKLCEANFAHANLDGADLRDADLARSNVFRASRKGAKISPAQVKDLLEIDPELDSTSRKEG